MIKNCAISYICPKYDSKSNKPPNEHVRATVPCVKYLDMSCEMGVNLEIWNTGEGISCNIEKIKRVKSSL
jgi:hypothetical protein